MIQYALKTGLLKLGKRGDAEEKEELMQLCMIETFKPVQVVSLMKEEQAKAIVIYMPLKEMQDRTIKDRACMDKRRQRKFIEKEEAGLSTVATE